jgi:uncharacterized protein involved in exopolysaccharide biosynthesis
MMILRRWYLIPLLTLLGGVLGWGIHQIKPPIYEARAVFTVTINYNQPDVLDEIDDDHYAEDVMIVSTMGAIQSADVLNQVASEAAQYNISPDDIVLGKRIFIERRTSNVELIVRHQDPQIAMDLANLWAEKALDYLQEAQVHALHTYTLNHEIKNLAACIQLAPSNQSGVCMNLTQAELENQLQKAEAELVVEVQASRGLVPAILFDLSRKAVLPDAPVVYQPQLLIAASAFIGFLLSVIAVQVGAAGGWKRGV